MTEMWGARPIAAQPLLDRPVLVDLDILYGPPPDDVTPWPGGELHLGLVLTGRVPGVLRQWARAVDGRWIGRVDFTVLDHHGAAVAGHERALVPAAALSPLDLPPRR